MTPEQQRIAIAEACGWIYRPEHDVEFNTPAGRVAPESWRIDYPNGDCEAACFDGLPDYLNDLNAMREAEKVLTEEQHRRFSWHLVQVTDDNYRTWSAFEYETLSVWEMSLGDVQACLRATASQRAEAFLRTLNLWTT